MVSFNMEYKKIYFDQTIAESIFSLNQARSHCMECYDGNFCSKCLENTVISDNKDKLDDSFDLINCINYIFYLPLMFNGPIINYNSFIFQIEIWKDSQHSILVKMNKILYALKLLLTRGAVRARDERTSRVNDLQPPPARLIAHLRRHAMRAEEHGGTIRHVVKRVDEAHTARLQIRHHLLVVHELMEAVDRLGMRKRKGARGFLDGRPHTHTETMRL